MSIEYTVLGVLMDQPTHGYSIKKTLSEIFSKTLGLNDGQLYPALARLEQRGWIRKQIIEQRRSPTKHLYRVTADGETAFFEWLVEQSAEPNRFDFFWKSGFLQQCGFFHYLKAERVAELCEQKRQDVESRLGELERVLRRMRERGADPYREMIVEYGIRYERMREQWLRDLCARALAREAPSPAEKQARA